MIVSLNLVLICAVALFCTGILIPDQFISVFKSYNSFVIPVHLEDFFNDGAPLFIVVLIILNYCYYCCSCSIYLNWIGTKKLNWYIPHLHILHMHAGLM